MKYISISGTVCAGKTTLLEALRHRLGARAAVHEERPQDNPFIREYYADSRRWSFHSQMAFLALYFDDPKWRGGREEFFFFDRCLLENLVIARYRLNQGDLTQDEFDIIEKMGQGIASLMPPIDKYIYISCPVELLLTRLRQRGKEYESELGRAYAADLKKLYDAWGQTLPPDKTLYLDASGEIDLDEVIRFLEKEACTEQ